MEITPTRTRPGRGRQALARVALLLALAVAFLLVVPASLGLEPDVVREDSLGGQIPRGSVVFSHTVPTAVLEVGDVIVFAPPSLSPTGEAVVRRVVDADSLTLRTAAGDGTRDPWVLRPDSSRVSRVAFHVPHVGLPLVERWLLVPVGAGLLAVLGLVVLAARRSGRSHVTVPSPRDGTAPRQERRQVVLSRR